MKEWILLMTRDRLPATYLRQYVERRSRPSPRLAPRPAPRPLSVLSYRGAASDPPGPAGVFTTLYRPDCVKPRPRSCGPAPLQQFDTALAAYRQLGRGSSPPPGSDCSTTGSVDSSADSRPASKAGQTEKYFDNLASLLEECARGLEL